MSPRRRVVVGQYLDLTLPVEERYRIQCSVIYCTLEGVICAEILTKSTELQVLLEWQCGIDCCGTNECIAHNCFVWKGKGTAAVAVLSHGRGRETALVR